MNSLNYNYILDPISGKRVSVFSEIGRSVVMGYMNEVNLIGGDKARRGLNEEFVSACIENVRKVALTNRKNMNSDIRTAFNKLNEQSDTFKELLEEVLPLTTSNDGDKGNVFLNFINSLCNEYLNKVTGGGGHREHGLVAHSITQKAGARSSLTPDYKILKKTFKMILIGVGTELGKIIVRTYVLPDYFPGSSELLWKLIACQTCINAVTYSICRVCVEEACDTLEGATTVCVEKNIEELTKTVLSQQTFTDELTETVSKLRTEIDELKAMLQERTEGVVSGPEIPISLFSKSALVDLKKVLLTARSQETPFLLCKRKATGSRSGSESGCDSITCSSDEAIRATNIFTLLTSGSGSGSGSDSGIGDGREQFILCPMTSACPTLLQSQCQSVQLSWNKDKVNVFTSALEVAATPSAEPAVAPEVVPAVAPAVAPALAPEVVPAVAPEVTPSVSPAATTDDISGSDRS